ncbi:hypothetical protein C0992_002722 [Termitomyces sp. T32_za158]|nr:hypothetical protein C0992_002722 [Termitomyces sp. T32_za158]
MVAIRLIALMLGRLRMPIDLAIDKYVMFSQGVFSDLKKWSIRGNKFKATVFESGIQGILQSAGFAEDVLMQEDDTSCRSFVVALPSANMTPRVFRTYEVTANQGYDCTVVQAARATTATPDLFNPVSIISGGISETFVGAGLGHSNPTSLVLKEAVMVFGLSQPVACFVSIGAGHFGHIAWEPNNVFGQLLHQIATNCEALAESFVESYNHIPNLFYRLNVDQGLQKMALDDWSKQGEIQTHSLAYLQKATVTQELNMLTNTLHTCPQTTTLELLKGGHISANHFNKKTPCKLPSALLPIIPAPSPLFIGREDILLNLEKCFDPFQSSLKMQVQLHYVLHGLGGAGKTQIALKFCHKFKSSSKASIEQFLTLLGQSAKLTDTTPAAALIWLCYQEEEWLMIFDNADDPDLNLQEFFPPCSHGNILITSRNEASKIYAPKNNDKIVEMSSDDSLEVFYKASQREKNEQEAAKELVKELGYLALAIVQAGSYLLYNPHIGVKQYLENYKKDKPRNYIKKQEQF